MNGNQWDFSDLTGKSEKEIDKVKKQVNDKKELAKVVKEQTQEVEFSKTKSESKIENSHTLTEEVQLSMQVEVKKPITITLDKSLIKLIDEKAAKIQTANNQGMRSKVINAALTRLFK